VMLGGTGQLGAILTRHSRRKGAQVTVFGREAFSSPEQLAGGLEQSDVCINLAGRNVNCRYNEANRRAIYNSRVETTRLLNHVISSLKHPPRVWLNASTATIYRHSLDRAMDESGELGGNEPGAPECWNFSIEVAKAWEEATHPTRGFR